MIYDSFLLSPLFLLPSYPPPPLLTPSQIAAEGRGTPPCSPGFTEDVYKVEVPDITEEGQPLFSGECEILLALSHLAWWVLVVHLRVRVSVCASVVRAFLRALHFREAQNKPDIFKQLASV